MSEEDRIARNIDKGGSHASDVPIPSAQGICDGCGQTRELRSFNIQQVAFGISMCTECLPEEGS